MAHPEYKFDSSTSQLIASSPVSHVVIKNGVKLRLDSSDAGYKIDADFAATEVPETVHAYFLYAEKVVIASNHISLEGKNVVICCNELVIERPGEVLINVSGASEGTTPPRAETTGNGAKGGNGSPGGSIWILIEDASLEVLKQLHLVANGGSGGQGQQVSSAGQHGGDGGDGAAPGNIYVAIGSNAIELAYKSQDVGMMIMEEIYNEDYTGTMHSATYKPKQDSWRRINARLIREILTPAKTLPDSALGDKEALKNLEKVTAAHVALAQELCTLLTGLDNLLVPPPQTGKEIPEAPEALKNAATTLVATVTTYLGSSSIPRSTDITSVQNLNTVLATWLKTQATRLAPGDVDYDDPVSWPETLADKGLKDSIVGLQLPALQPALEYGGSPCPLAKECLALARSLQAVPELESSMKLESNMGARGAGGINTAEAKHNGKEGKNEVDKAVQKYLEGPDHPQSVNLSDFNGLKHGRCQVSEITRLEKDLKIPVPFAFPEQCAMTLEQADLLYYGRNKENIAKAANIYSRLQKRMSLLGDMLWERDAGGELGPLVQAYIGVGETGAVVAAFMRKMMLDPFTQLQAIKERAAARLQTLLAGQDLFGMDADWVPRLNMTHYRNGFVDAIAVLEAVEERLSLYERADAKQNERENAITAELDHIKDAQDGADAIIALVEDHKNGLPKTADVIASLTPKMAATKKALLAALNSIPQQVMDKITINPKKAVEAFGAFAFAPTGLNGLAQVGGVLFGAVTEVTNDRGEGVKKEFVVNQVAECSDTLKSLTETFSTLSNGSLQVEDPGAAKVIALKSDITKITNEYKGLLKDIGVANLPALVDAYLQAVLRRNNAVMEYNAKLGLYVNAKSTIKSLRSRRSAVAGQAMSIDVNIPAARQVLRDQRNRCWTTAMHYLALEDKALRFWAVRSSTVIDKLDSTCLEASGLKALESEQLKQAVETTLTEFANNPTKHWTESRWYELTAQQLSTLKHAEKIGEDYVSRVDIDLESIVQTDTHVNFELTRQDGNIRLNTVRVWLFGAQLLEANRAGHKVIQGVIWHSGQETIVDTTDAKKPYSFAHDPVHVPFDFLCDRIAKIEDCVDANTVSKVSLESAAPFWSAQRPDDRQDDVVAAVGPLATWTVELRASKNMADPSTPVPPDPKGPAPKGGKADIWWKHMLQGVTKGFIEFRGRSMG